MCGTMSILEIIFLERILLNLFDSGGLLCLPFLLRFLLALLVSMVAAIFGLLCKVDVRVILVKLMLSNHNVAAWLGTATNSSFDTESRRGLPPRSGDTPSSCMSMS